MAVSSLVAAGGGVIRKQTTFTASGTFTLPTGYGAGQPLIVDIEICGGGGGGGGGGKHTTVGTYGYGGSGGASGVVVLYKNVSLTANATVTLGAGGSGGTGRVTSIGIGTDGANGGTSNVNSLYYAPGGGAGSFGSYGGNNYTRRGFGVNSQGFYIPGGHVVGVANTPGAGGGSGSPHQGESMIGDTYNLYGGSKGMGPAARPINFSDNLNQYTYNALHVGYGSGINFWRPNGQTVGTSVSIPGPTSEMGILQRGAGGSGGMSDSSSSTGGGGYAGTKNDGGTSGYMNSTSGLGTVTGQTATDAGCGGGGGGGATSSFNAGNGGAGATGYCIITYWG